MIRINLLSEGRRPVVARKAKPKLAIGSQDPSTLILIAGVVLGLLGGGAWHYSVNAELKEVEQKLVKANREMNELKNILKEVRAFKRKKKRLTTKINIIKDLHAKQKGPVQVMDSISRALPDLVWLASMQVKGNVVSLKGSAFNTNAIATFIENLGLVPNFDEPNTKNVQQARGGRSYAFAIEFRFRTPRADGSDSSDEDDDDA